MRRERKLNKSIDECINYPSVDKLKAIIVAQFHRWTMLRKGRQTFVRYAIIILPVVHVFEHVAAVYVWILEEKNEFWSFCGKTIQVRKYFWPTRLNVIVCAVSDFNASLSNKPRNVTDRTAESQAQERQTDSRTEAREVPSPYVTAVPVEDKLSVILSNSIYSTYYSPTSTHTYTAA